MCPPRRVSTIAERYDRALNYARGKILSPETPRPLPTRYWPNKNIELLEHFHAWLLEGGACEYSTTIIYMPIAGHALGLNLKPHSQINLGTDLDCALDYIRAKGAGKDWLNACRNGLEKFRRFLRLERGLGEVQKTKHFDVPHNTQGLPTWLVGDLRRFQRVQQRNWRTARIELNIRRFWSVHLRIWRVLCEQYGVLQLANLRRQHILDYMDQRLEAGLSASAVNNELLTLRTFLVFLQAEGYSIQQSLLLISGPNVPERLPKYLTEEQVRLLQCDFESRVTQAKLSNHRRDALLDRAIFYLLWQGGLRTSEVEELCMEDLEMEESKLSVRDGKGRKDRTVYITETTIHVLQEYLAVRGTGSGDHAFLYRNAPLHRSLIYRRMKAAGERVGVKVHPHRLRHTCATQLLNAGCRVTSIQRFLGHRDLATTMVYACVHDQTVAKDYFKAMEHVEEQLKISSLLKHEPEPNDDEVGNVQTILNKSESGSQMVLWLERLAVPELSMEERLEIVENIKQSLSIDYPSHLYPSIVYAR